MKYVFIFLIRIYQRTLSRLMPSSCRFYPSCSQYGVEAIKKYGVFKGGWLTLKRKDAHFIPYGVTANRACPARGVAPVMMRAATREVLRRFALASSVSHTRSLPSRGPAYLTPAGVTGPSRSRLAGMRLLDRWADVGRSFQQLVFGTWMVVDARRQKLCATYFEEVRQ